MVFITVNFNLRMIKMVNKPIYLAASLLAILSVIAIGASGNMSAFAQSDKVQASIVPGATTLTDTAVSPNPIQAKVGQTVVWTNDDSAMHTVTSGLIGAPDAGKLFDSGLAGPTALTAKGKTFEHTFDTAGEFDYHCTLHPAMTGQVIVT
ncbi:MAG TPA: plastocyanin/azurin family copper-binding protein [Candidatus Nitrosocosmicus sp.]|nr:plastocyanin/azurin family copper-binding protein [Candidatus Nitrosocosmicus sp.]